jgi:hypothetical protein
MKIVVIGPDCRPAQPDRASPSFPGDRHAVSAHASKTKPVKPLAVFMVDTNETEPTIPFEN